MAEFGLSNWLVVVAFLVATTWFGHKMSGKVKGLDGFFLGGNSLPWWAVSGSIVASQLSAVTIVAVPGFLFRDTGNLLFLQGTLIGFILAKFLMVLIFLKPYYEKKIYSPYDFIENRLGSRVSSLARILFVVGAIFGHGIRLLTVALVFSVVAGIPIGNSILIMGVFAIIWTLMGGVKTVIWTDFLLLLVILAGVIFTIIQLAGAIPFGLGEAMDRFRDADKLTLFDFSLNPKITWTVWTSLICFTVFELAQNSVDQVITQRMMCCKDWREARKAVLGSLVIIAITLMMAVVGLGVWLYYRVNPLPPKIAAFLAEQPSRAYPYYVIDRLPAGLSGLIIAAIFAAGISTLDSAIAALSETSINGFYKKYINKAGEDKHYLYASRVAVVAWGVILAGLAYAWGKLVQNEAMLNLAYKAPVLTYGPMLMIALCAINRRFTPIAIFTGTAMGVITALAMLVMNACGKGLVVDGFWIYPATCIVFVIGAGIVSLGGVNKNSLPNV